MAKFYYNGVLLPEIPSDVLAKYQNFVIVQWKSSGNYALLCAPTVYRWYYEYSNSQLKVVRCTVAYYTYKSDIDEWSLNYEQQTEGSYSFDSIDMVWANNDVMVGQNGTEVYFSATEPVPEGAMSDDVYYQIKESTLTSFGNQARRINGTTDKLTTAQMLEIFEGAGSGDGGVEDGYDVTFYDENGEELAFYSVKQGHTIAKPPKYDCLAWQTSDGATVSFPYVPTSDISLYANSDTYADQLYKFYGVDKAIYPYICFIYDPASQNYGSSLCFLQTPITTTAQRLTCMYGYGSIDITDFEDLASVTEKIMSAITSVYSNTLKSISLEDTEALASRNRTYYTNYDATLTYVQLYRLDDVAEPLPYDGLANGYDVMFYDENNEGLAFYSIKSGHTINPPVYGVKAWITKDNETINFPYTPTGDLIVYANKETWASVLYTHYNIDAAIYPYLGIWCSRLGTIIAFVKTITLNNASSMQFKDGYYGYIANTDLYSNNGQDLEATINSIKATFTTLKQASDIGSMPPSTTPTFSAINFDHIALGCTSYAHTITRLDQ